MFNVKDAKKKYFCGLNISHSHYHTLLVYSSSNDFFIVNIERTS